MAPDLGFSAPDIGNKATMTTGTPDSNAPDWRTVRPGINACGTCNKCGQHIVVPLGRLQNVNLVTTPMRCPRSDCSGGLQNGVSEFDLKDCKFKFKGMLADDSWTVFGWTTEREHRGSNWGYFTGSLKNFRELTVYCSSL